MAWQAQLTRDLAPDWATMKVVATVEFYDDVDRTGTVVPWTFEIEAGNGSVNQQRQELRALVEDRGRQIRDFAGRVASLKAGVSSGTTITIPLT